MKHPVDRKKEELIDSKQNVRRLRFGFVVLSLLLLTCFPNLIGCGNGGSEGSIPLGTVTDYLPLNPGMSYGYTYHGVMEGGPTTATVGVLQSYHGIQAIPVYFDSPPKEGMGETTGGAAYVTETRNQLNLVGMLSQDQDIPFDPALLLLNGPFSISSCWSADTSARVTIDDYTVTINASISSTVTDTENVNVPAGSFENCLKISAIITAEMTSIVLIQIPIPVTVWLAKNVGVVKVQATIPVLPTPVPIPSGDITIELSTRG